MLEQYHAFVNGELVNPYFAVLALLLLAAVWLVQFVQLMLLSDSDLPGRYDKVLWAAAFIFVFPLAPFAFLFWKRAYLSMRDAEREPPLTP